MKITRSRLVILTAAPISVLAFIVILLKVFTDLSFSQLAANLKEHATSLLFKPDQRVYDLVQKYSQNTYPSVEIESRKKQYNVIVVLTDDQTHDTWQHMPYFSNLARKEGIIFRNAFATDPTCCTFRASFFSGGFNSHETGVKSNNEPNGSLHKLNEGKTLPVYLQAAGIKTGFSGKYMHGYKPGYVPPGWSYFVANESGAMIYDYWRLKNITYGRSDAKARVGTVKNINIPERKYITNFQTDVALEFIRDNHKQPFFFLLSLYAPHTPHIPESAQDEEVANSIEFKCAPESELSTKPAWVLTVASEQKRSTCGKKNFVGQVALLQSVDRNIERIQKALDKYNIRDSTILIFAADNGIMLRSKHLCCQKGMPYEESIRVPLVIIHPEMNSGKAYDGLVSANLDLPATIMDIAGIKMGTEGHSLLKLANNIQPERRHLLIENYGYIPEIVYKNLRDRIPPVIWNGLRTPRWKYIQYTTGEQELYDLSEDPHETTNLAGRNSYDSILKSLRSVVDQEKGLAIATSELPKGTIGQEFLFRLQAWGGKKPYKWKISPELPKGLVLNPSTGVISGVPVQSGKHELGITVEDSSKAKHSSLPDHFTWNFVLPIADTL